jgi:hypothetical protein
MLHPLAHPWPVPTAFPSLPSVRNPLLAKREDKTDGETLQRVGHSSRFASGCSRSKTRGQAVDIFPGSYRTMCAGKGNCSRVASLWLAILTACASLCFPQRVASQQISRTRRGEEVRAESRDSVVPRTRLPSQQREESEINDLYERIFLFEGKGECDIAIRRYETEIIPLAEHSKSEMARSKFLFLANRGIGDCYLARRHWKRAELYLENAMNYLRVWPGRNDSDYPINLEEIAAAQMGQQQWMAAEESLKRSLSLFDGCIKAALKSGDPLIRALYSGRLYGLKARTLGYLAVVYLHEGETTESLAAADLAYDEATKADVPAAFLKQAIKFGRAIAHASGNDNAVRAWSRRLAPKAGQELV